MSYQPITVRAVQERGKMRLRTEAVPAQYVQASREWRATLERGCVLTIWAKPRADDECMVMASAIRQ